MRSLSVAAAVALAVLAFAAPVEAGDIPAGAGVSPLPPSDVGPTPVPRGFDGPRHGPPPPGHPAFGSLDGRHERHHGSRYFGGETHEPGDWPRPRRYWFGEGPIFVPDASADYVVGAEDYDDGGDPSGCTIFRKAFDRAGAFLGWVRIDSC